MSAEDLAAASAAARAAHAELREMVTQARAELEHQVREPLVSEEDRRELQAAAQRGDMGREMRELSEEFRRGNGDWEQFLRGADGRRELLEAFVEKTREDNADRLGEAFAQTEAPPDVDDPRPPDRRPPPSPSSP